MYAFDVKWELGKYIESMITNSKVTVNVLLHVHLQRKQQNGILNFIYLGQGNHLQMCSTGGDWLPK